MTLWFNGDIFIINDLGHCTVVIEFVFFGFSGRFCGGSSFFCGIDDILFSAAADDISNMDILYIREGIIIKDGVSEFFWIGDVADAGIEWFLGLALDLWHVFVKYL